MKNQTRSLVGDLDTGMVDGKYKAIRPNAGGVVEPATARNRTELGPKFDIVEAHPKIAPDGTTVA